MTSDSSNDRIDLYDQEGVFAFFEDRQNSEAEEGTGQLTHLLSTPDYNSENMQMASNSDGTHNSYGLSLQLQVANREQAFVPDSYTIPLNQAPHITIILPPQLPNPEQSTWDIRNPDLPECKEFDKFEIWPDGNQQKVYSIEEAAAKRHKSGWAMRNTNNHSRTILKKTCLGVLVCSKSCKDIDGKEFCFRPAICGKARDKQYLRKCPVVGCGGRIVQRRCIGNGGYPVTHSWRQHGGAIFFQSRGKHLHPKPTTALPIGEIHLPHSTIPQTLDSTTSDRANEYKNETDDYAAIIQLEMPPTLEERQQLGLPSTSNEMAIDLTNNLNTLPAVEAVLHEPPRIPIPPQNETTIIVDLDEQNASPVNESQVLNLSTPVNAPFATPNLHEFVLQYDNGVNGRTPRLNSPSWSVYHPDNTKG